MVNEGVKSAKLHNFRMLATLMVRSRQSQFDIRRTTCLRDSAKMSQNLAESLLDDDDSSSIRESPSVKQPGNEYICPDNSDDFEAANTEHSLAQCDGPPLREYLQQDGSRLLWRGR